MYDPGSLVCQVDDFTVEAPEQWPTTGKDLLAVELAGRVKPDIMKITSRREAAHFARQYGLVG